MALFIRSFSVNGCNNVCDAVLLILAYLHPKNALYCLSSGTLFSSVVWMSWIPEISLGTYVYANGTSMKDFKITSEWDLAPN